MKDLTEVKMISFEKLKFIAGGCTGSCDIVQMLMLLHPPEYF